MSNFNNNQQNKLERERMAAIRQAKTARMLAALDEEMASKGLPIPEDDDDYLSPVPEKVSTHQTKPKEMGKMEFKHGNIAHFVNGKRISTESAYNTYNWAAYIAGAATMYHTAIGTNNINLEVFSAILTNAFMIYGPKQSLELPAVSACMEYINDNDIDAWDAMTTASRAIRTNGPARVYSDAVIIGKSAMIADLSTGEVVVPGEVGLSIRATQSLAPLLVATVEKPAQAMEAIIADLGHYDRSLTTVENQIHKAIKEGSCPDITETNSFRRLSKVPGTMTTNMRVRSKHGAYQGVFEALEEYHEEPPGILVVPDYTLGLTGSFDSCGSISRVIPLPKSPEHYSLTLYSVVGEYDEGLRCLLKLEEDRRQDPDLRKTEGSARSTLHAPFASHYASMRTDTQGMTPKGLRYVTLADENYVGTKDLLEGAQKGIFDHSPAMVRVTDYFQGQVKSLDGYCIVTDLPMMVGVYVSPHYVQNYFKDSLKDRSGRPKCTDGFYVLKPGPKGTETHYSAWIEKYIFSHVAGTIMGPEVKENLLTQYLKGYQEDRRGNDVVKNILRDLRVCYDKQYPSLAKVALLTPGYSARKAFKYRTIMGNFDAVDDDEFQQAVNNAQSTPPEEVGGQSPAVDTGGGVEVKDPFAEWTYSADDDAGDEKQDAID